MIFLTGMPGAGKSYWGNLLAAKYSFAHVDMDIAIEQRAGRPIPEIFHEQGETYFRQVEKEVLEEIIAKCGNEHVVISCGGGTPVFFDNMALMKKNGCVVFIDEPLQTIVERVTGNNDRPLLSDADVLLKLEQLYHERINYYRQAHYTLSQKEISIDEFDKIIQQCTDRQ